MSKCLDLTSRSHLSILNFDRHQSTMVADVDEAVKIYRDLARIPRVKLGRICSEEAPGHLQVYSEWLQRDLERNEQIKFARGHIVQLDVTIPTPPYELSNEQWNKESPSGKYRAIVRKLKDKKGDEKQFLEIWSDTRKLCNIDVLAVDRHGKIYEDDQFGSLEWSHSETHLLYVAERKVPKIKSYFDEKQETGASASEVEKGNEFVYKDNWGEQLSEKIHPILCVLDIEGGCISLLENLPDNISPGQAVWCPDDVGVVCVGWWHDAPRLGLIYCPMRRSALFHIDLKTFTCTILGANDRSVRSPVFSPDHMKLIYLDNPSGGPHAQCSRLILCDWPTKGIVPVVDIVRHATASEFQGIFTARLHTKCWSLDSKRIVISTNWRSKVELVLVYIETGVVVRLTDDPKIGHWTLLEVHNDLILAACSSIDQPEYLVIGHLPSSGSEKSIRWTRLDSEPNVLPEISWKICPVSVPPARVHPKYNHVDYEYIFLEPVLSDNCKPPPLVVYNHGGPHSGFVADFQIYLAGLCRCGFALLLVNYRGSYGFGADCIDSLPSRIGSQDVLDIQSVVEEICSSGRVDADKVFVIGGSHGGFLTTHLIGQYPEYYKAAVARNPVINIASMLGVTDIPDWNFVETGLPYDHNYVPTPDTYREMLKCSPIVNIDKIKTPLMLMLGGKDLRVPPSQGLQMKNALEGRGKTVRTLWYPDCSHPLSDVPAEADAFVNIVQWFIQHMKA